MQHELVNLILIDKAFNKNENSLPGVCNVEFTKYHIAGIGKYMLNVTVQMPKCRYHPESLLIYLFPINSIISMILAVYVLY